MPRTASPETGRRLFASLAGYRAAWLPADAAAALTLAAIAVPEQLATAELAGMPPATGLLAFAAGTLAFAALGRHRLVSVGADSTIAPLVAGALAGLAAVGSAEYAGAAALLALAVGAILVLAGIFRLGWIADLLSIPVTTGFLAGIAVHIIAGQLPAILGVPAPDGTLPARLLALASRLGEASAAPLIIGLGTLVLCLAAERIDARIPGPLIALALSALVARGLGLDVAMLGALPPVVPRPELWLPPWREAAGLLPVALMVALICMVQTASVLQAFPSGPDGGDLASREFAAVGAGSLLAGLAGAFPVDASPPRTAIVAGAGGRSQLAGLLAASVVILLALVAGGALAHVPQAALAGVLAFVAFRIVRVKLIASIVAQSPLEGLLVAASALLVVLLPIEIGAGLAIGLSALHSLYTIARPQAVELARIPGTTVWWTVAQGQPGEHEPGILVFAFGAPLNFMNVGYLLDGLAAAIAAKEPPCRLVVVEASGVIGIDFTGARLFLARVAALRGQGIAVAMARLESEAARQAARRTGILGALGDDHVFRSVEEAVRALGTGSAG